MTHQILKAKNNSTAEDAAIDALYVLHPDLSRLLRAIRRSEPGQFALYFARCNIPAYRSRLVAALKQRTTRPIVEVSLAGLPLRDQTLDDALLSRVPEAPADGVLFVYDLDTLLPHAQPDQQQAVLLQLNWRRSAFSRLRRTLVFWLPEHALQLLHNQAPDFADWYSGIYEFDVPSDAKSAVVYDSLQGFYDGNVHAAGRLNAEEKQRWIEVLHNLLEEGLPPQEQARLLNDLGQVYHSTGHYKAALEAFQNAHTLSQQNGQKKLEATTLNNISQIFKARGENDAALNYLQQSLTIRQEIGDKAGEGRALNNISQIYHARGDFKTALNYLQQSLTIRQETGDKAGEGATLNNMAAIAYARGEYDTALNYLQQSLTIQQEIGDRAGEGATLNNISQIYDVRGDLETALNYLQQSLTIRQEIGDKAGLCNVLFNMGYIYWQNNQQDEALQHWVEAYRIANKLKLAKILRTLEQLADQLELPGDGLDAWETLAHEQDVTRQDSEMRGNEEKQICDEKR